MPKLIITKTYDHRWPSRAITCFPARPEPYTVKREVVKAAVAKGYGYEPESGTDDDIAGKDQPAGLLDGSDPRPVSTGPGEPADGDVHSAGAEDGADQPATE